MSAHLSYAEAVIVGAFQGVTELFPVSSSGIRSWCPRWSEASGRVT